MEGVADDLTLQQREELAVAIMSIGTSSAVALQIWAGWGW